MPLDLASFLRHTDPAEQTTVLVRNPDDSLREIPALLIAQTGRQKLFVTLETPRRYLTHTRLPEGPAAEDEEEIEIDFAQDYAEIEDLLEDAGLDGRHADGRGILYPNLLYLLLNP